MAENEESEITESIAIMARTLTGSAMQYNEVTTRRHTAETQQRNADEANVQRSEAQLASSLRQEVYHQEFWRTASSQNIADHMTVAAHLGQNHPEARNAAMHIADTIRNDYGINVEQINRDHPTSLEGRHVALRDALNDHFQKARAEVEADQARIAAQRETSAPEISTPAAESGAATDQPAERVEAAAPVEQTSEVQTAEDRAAEARVSEAANLAAADRAGSEARQDREHARSEEATGGRQPQSYSRVSQQELQEIQGRDPALAEVRRRQGSSFGISAKAAMNQPAEKIPTPARGAGVKQAKDQEISR